MSDAIEIRTIKEIADLTEIQQEVFLKDLAEWLRVINLHRKISPLMPEGVQVAVPDDVIHWVDDDRPGEISGINFSVRIDRSKPEARDGE